MKLHPSAASYLQIFLLCLSAVFVVSTWLEFSRDYSLQNRSRAVQAGPDMPAVTQESGSTELPPITEFTSIIERPLFMSDRRPARVNDGDTGESEPIQVTPGPGNNVDLLLSAIVLDKEEAIALVATGSDHKIHRLVSGDSIAGWTVAEIKEREIVLTRGNETRNLELKVKKSPATSRIPQRRRRTTATSANSRVLSGSQTGQEENSRQSTTTTPTIRSTPDTGQENLKQTTAEIPENRGESN